MNLPHYIDTRPGAPGLFSPPCTGNLDYATWLRRRYDEGIGKDGKHTAYIGVAQRINAVIHAARNGAPILAFGPHAGAAARVIEQLSDGTIAVEVLAS